MLPSKFVVRDLQNSKSFKFVVTIRAELSNFILSLKFYTIFTKYLSTSGSALDYPNDDTLWLLTHTL